MFKASSLTGTQILVEAFLQQKVKVIFGYTGGAIMPLFDELSKHPQIKLLYTRHEQGAGFAAQGYARATGQLAYVLTTSGPGAANSITTVADAMMDSIPMMVITGQVPTSVIGTDAFQENDVVGMMLPITKHATVVADSNQLLATFHELSLIAMSGRTGPVHLDLPKDIQFASCQLPKLQIAQQKQFQQLVTKTSANNLYPTEKISAEKYQQAAKMINQAQRIVIFCGHGVIMAKASAEFKKFIEKGKLPFASTSHGLSAIKADHPLHLGMMGMHGTVAANKAIYQADCIVALGMRFDDRVTGKLTEYAPQAKIIHVDIDASEINKIIPADLALNTDLKTVLKKLTPLIKKKERTKWLQEIRRHNQRWDQYIQPIIEKGLGKNKALLMKTIITQLSKITRGQDNIVSDVGIHEMICARYYNFQRINTWFHSGGAGTMGFSLPTAIGVKIARPAERVWAIMGDGGFQMNVQELGTILAEKLDIKIIIMNNGTLGMVRQWQDLFFNKNFVVTDLNNPDFVKLAASYGILGKRVAKVKDIETSIQWAIKTKGSTVLEFVCDKDEKILPMIPPGANLNQMIEKE